MVINMYCGNDIERLIYVHLQVNAIRHIWIPTLSSSIVFKWYSMDYDTINHAKIQAWNEKSY